MASKFDIALSMALVNYSEIANRPFAEIWSKLHMLWPNFHGRTIGTWIVFATNRLLLF